jgi:hypothetical protein
MLATMRATMWAAAGHGSFAGQRSIVGSAIGGGGGHG